MRKISDFYYEVSGIYRTLCRYLAYLYRYDWVIQPYILDLEKEKDKNKTDKILKDFANVLSYFDKSNIPRTCGNIALEVIKHGAYYCMWVDAGDHFALQQLPADYCRVRFYDGVNPLVELNLQFFDKSFKDLQYRLKVLKTFPKDVQKAYIAYKEGKLKGDTPKEKTCWFMLEPGTAFKLCLNDSDMPPFAGVIPSLIDLDAAQDLDRKKTMQQLLKIIIQKLPLDKNGDLLFDVDEAKDIHNSAVNMLSNKAVGVDVLTTFADVEVANMRDSATVTSVDDLEKVERTVYNNSGITQNLFNAEGNIAVTNSVLVDEASIRDLILRFNDMFNTIAEKFTSKKHYYFVFNMLETTQFNYKEISKMYKDSTTLGYPKLWSQVALGHSQSAILAAITFENEVLDLASIMIPPMSSNTRSNKIDVHGNAVNGNTTTENKSSNNASGETGRPRKEDNERSDKTIANQQSMG